MAFVLTPRFAPAYHCDPWACAPQRPVYRKSRTSVPSFVPFLSQVDELLSELDREARRATHHQRQQRKCAFRARFDVRENKEGYEVLGEVPGFSQENISIEVTDEHTLKIAGNTDSKVEQPMATPIVAELTKTAELEKADALETDTMDGLTLAEAGGVETPTHSDTESHKSYQATVEDDFEDLGADTSSTVSTSSEPKEPKGKEKVLLSERVHGSFERTFEFPARIDAANVRASLKNGVLSINVPKASTPTIRRITIQ
ncbi:HSP20-like chaperone [Lojkania enalia]|uniref:HSP20-like chaperone n=1 Tax=Lojkania enalia TaxID=147567 RepID=A0A9P4N0V6_9PLEO|nr:HSP20-like chaperone [Didymosphaeria enalia]